MPKIGRTLDRQVLSIALEHPNFEETKLVFQPDVKTYMRGKQPRNLWGLGEEIVLVEYEIDSTQLSTTHMQYKTDFGNPSAAATYSRLTISVAIRRDSGPYTIKILIPLIIILSLAYLVFYIPGGELEVASGLTVTSLLASISFQLSLAGNLPEIGYLVSSDRIFHISYLLIMLAMVETVLTFNLEKKGYVELSERIEWHSRWVYPTVFVLGVGIVVTHGGCGRFSALSGNC